MILLFILLFSFYYTFKKSIAKRNPKTVLPGVFAFSFAKLFLKVDKVLY